MNMYSPAGLVYGPQAGGFLPYWMLAASSGLPGGRPVATVGAEEPGSPPRGHGGPRVPSSVGAYQDLLKRTAHLNHLLYPSVIPLPGTLTASESSCTPASFRGSAMRGKDHHQEPSAQSCPMSPTAVRSKDLKFGIDRILQASDQASKGKAETEFNPNTIGVCC